MNFADRLIDGIKEKRNPSVIGLDPRIEKIPEHIKRKAYEFYGKTLKGAAEAVLTFNKGIIDSVYDIVPVVKPQLAFYEILGHEGIRVLEETIKYALGKNLLVICDAKRSDIGSSAEAYSRAFIGKSKNGDIYSSMGADAVTVNPFFGYDGLIPFIEDCRRNKKGIFLLVKTSNPSSVQFQDIVTDDGEHVYEKLAQMVNELGKELIGCNGYSSVGAVVGATHPEQARILRRKMPYAYFLVPGYGAQGGTAADAAVSFDKNGLGALVNASRSVLFAYQSDRYSSKYTEEEYGMASREEALRMRDDINNATGCFQTAGL